MTQRADIFNILANSRELKKILEISSGYNKELENYKSEKDKANFVIHIYLCAAFDEGYRKGLRETQESIKTSFNPTGVSIKNRKYGTFFYVNDKDLKSSFRLVKKRRKSNRLLKKLDFMEKDKLDLYIIIQTAFESGYLKSQLPQEIASAVFDGDSSMVNMFNDLFGSLFTEGKI